MLDVFSKDFQLKNDKFKIINAALCDVLIVACSLQGGWIGYLGYLHLNRQPTASHLNSSQFIIIIINSTMTAAEIKARKREDYPYMLDYRTRWYVYSSIERSLY